jgi:murein DD-endopeptidase MepM/ murein hydrolase activator NlpD
MRKEIYACRKHIAANGLFWSLVVVVLSGTMAVAQQSVSGPRELPHATNRSFLLDSASQDSFAIKTSTYCTPTYCFPKAQGYARLDSFQTSAFDNKILDFYHFDVLSLKDTFEFDLIDATTGTSKFVFPVKGRVSSGFGPRYFWGYHFHKGTDIALQRGDSVVAAMDGVVRIVRVDRWGYGNFIVVTHEGGLETVYGHLDKSLAIEGQQVKAGDLIGLGGSTGRSTGPHLHFEFRFMGEAFDAEKVCDFNTCSLKHERIALERNWFSHLDKTKKTPALASANVAAIGDGGAVYHRIRPGENLGTIAGSYRTSVANICRLNGIGPNTTIFAGKTIRVK